MSHKHWWGHIQVCMGNKLSEAVKLQARQGICNIIILCVHITCRNLKLMLCTYVEELSDQLHDEIVPACAAFENFHYAHVVTVK